MPSERARAWLDLATRHLRVATLLVEEFPDVAYFHLYHAFECSACGRSLSLDPDNAIPDRHEDKLDDYLGLEPDPNLRAVAAELEVLLDRRNESLYVGWRRGRIRRPEQRFVTADVTELMQALQSFLERLGELPG